MRITRSELRKIIREEAQNLNENVNPELNPNQFYIDHPKLVELINGMGRPVTEFEKQLRGTYRIEFKGGMRSGVSISHFQLRGIEIRYIAYDNGYIMMSVGV